MRFMEIIAVYFENPVEHTETLCGQNADCLKFKQDYAHG
jgi:hypothetical protein